MSVNEVLIDLLHDNITADLPAEKRGPGVFRYLGVAEEERVSEC